MKMSWTPWRTEHVLDTVPKIPGCHVGDLSELSSKKKLRLMERLSAGCMFLHRRLPPMTSTSVSTWNKQQQPVSPTTSTSTSTSILFAEGEGDHNSMIVYAEIRTILQRIEQTVELFVPDFLKLPTPPTP